MLDVNWRLKLTITLAVAGLLAALLWSAVLAGSGASVTGVVVDQDGSVAGANVRVRATENSTISDAGGAFRLVGLEEGVGVEIAAWDDGYYIASALVTPTATGVTLTLRPYHTEDHPDYEWASPDVVCAECHPMLLSQWRNNAHGGAVSNPRFFSLYNGTDVSGENQVAPGFSDDFPGMAGNCASCHAPGAGADGYLSTGMNAVRDEATAGIHCDFCHKTGGVYLNPASETVYPNVPGVEGLRLLRPPQGDDIFFGPYDDIHDPDTYLPAIARSEFCAPCHQFSFWGAPIYESYSEWLASPYADAGVMCQDCHMPPNGDDHFALPEKGGLPHPPETIPSHLQLGALSEELLQNTVEMAVQAEQVGRLLKVSVTITNTGAGHHVPTDHPGRHLLLTVGVQTDGGAKLTQVGGPTVPVWGGAEAGLPGKAYAKVLKDVQTGESPVVSYWKQTLIESDSRIPALGSDYSTYFFALPPDVAQTRIDVRLLFRRLFADLAGQKGWDAPDILMARTEITHTMNASRVYLPFVR